MKTTTIKAFGDTWAVPRGFGATYQRVARDHGKLLAAGRPGEVIGAIRDMLALIGYEASIEAVAEWPARKRVEAFVHAVNVHLRAGDNPLPAHPKPDWMPEPWKGPERGEGAFAGPGGTVLTA